MGGGPIRVVAFDDLPAGPVVARVPAAEGRDVGHGGRREFGVAADEHDAYRRPVGQDAEIDDALAAGVDAAVGVAGNPQRCPAPALVAGAEHPTDLAGGT